MDNKANNKRIAKNTLFLYFRMAITMIVQIYTSKVILENLGVIDYGVYSIVGSFIIMFTFISGPLEAATQRFMIFELGRGNENRLNTVFNISLYSYIILSLFLAIIIEIIGVWYINNKMQLPSGRTSAALWTFHFSILTLIINLCKTPFSSLIVAYERMSYYAYVSIIDVTLKLLSATALAYFTLDKLKLYAANITLVSIIGLVFLWVYCTFHFRNIRLSRLWDKILFNEMINFSGWTMFGSVANITSNQGLNILLNYFFGVVVNAAMGIATQVSSAVNQFVENFQVAFRPQIVKYYAKGDKNNLYSLIFNATKYSMILLFAIACPVIFNVDFLLEIWLKAPPEQANQFTIIFLLISLVATMSAPLIIVIQATGTIKIYQIVISCCILQTIVISFILLYIGFPAITVLIIKFCVDSLCYFMRLIFVKRFIKLPMRYYAIKVLLPSGAIILLSFIYMTLINTLLGNGWIKFIFTTVLFFVTYIPLVLFIGFSHDERKRVYSFINSKIYTHQ